MFLLNLVANPAKPKPPRPARIVELSIRFRPSNICPITKSTILEVCSGLTLTSA
jgi:hypothetical protein